MPWTRSMLLIRMHHQPPPQNHTSPLLSSRQIVHQRTTNHPSPTQKAPSHCKEIYVKGLGFLHQTLPSHNTNNLDHRFCTVWKNRRRIHKKTQENVERYSLPWPLNQEHEDVENPDNQCVNSLRKPTIAKPQAPQSRLIDPILQNPDPTHPASPYMMYTRRKVATKN